MRKIKLWILSVLHNCVAHPLMPFLPDNLGKSFHNYTADLWEKEVKKGQINNETI